MEPTELYTRIVELGRRCGASRVVLYGSRARGEHRPSSDVDVAVYGVPADQRGRFWWSLEELPTLLKFDIVHISPATDAAFLRRLEQEGVILYAEDR